MSDEHNDVTVGSGFAIGAERMELVPDIRACSRCDGFRKGQLNLGRLLVGIELRLLSGKPFWRFNKAITSHVAQRWGAVTACSEVH